MPPKNNPFKKIKISIPGPPPGRGYSENQIIIDNFIEEYDGIKEFFDELPEEEKNFVIEKMEAF